MITEEKFFAVVANLINTGREAVVRRALILTLLDVMAERFGQVPAAVVQRAENTTSTDLWKSLIRSLTSTTPDEVFG